MADASRYVRDSLGLTEAQSLATRKAWALALRMLVRRFHIFIFQ